MKDYYKKRIDTIYDRFYSLFKEMLIKADYKNADNLLFFIEMAKEVKKLYPNLSEQVGRVVYYYTDVNDSEEKMEYLLLLYINIKENFYGRA